MEGSHSPFQEVARGRGGRRNVIMRFAEKKGPKKRILKTDADISIYVTRQPSPIQNMNGKKWRK
jgi:hypothetical protein